jgi:hypothetical protein
MKNSEVVSSKKTKTKKRFHGGTLRLVTKRHGENIIIKISQIARRN